MKISEFLEVTAFLVKYIFARSVLFPSNIESLVFVFIVVAAICRSEKLNWYDFRNWSFNIDRLLIKHTRLK